MRERPCCRRFIFRSCNTSSCFSLKLREADPSVIILKVRKIFYYNSDDKKPKTNERNVKFAYILRQILQSIKYQQVFKNVSLYLQYLTKKVIVMSRRTIKKQFVYNREALDKFSKKIYIFNGPFQRFQYILSTTYCKTSLKYLQQKLKSNLNVLGTL